MIGSRGVNCPHRTLNKVAWSLWAEVQIKIFNDIFLLDMYLTEILNQGKEGLSRVSIPMILNLTGLKQSWFINEVDKRSCDIFIKKISRQIFLKPSDPYLSHIIASSKPHL